MSKLKILITGGAGFVGSNLCKRLLSEGHEVIVMDNFLTGNKDNLKGLDIEIIRHDITAPFSIDVDRIYNLACPASPVHYQHNPIRTAKASILGAINVLNVALETGARVLQASTSEVYGDPLVHPQPETYWGNVNINGIRSCYDEGKRMAETLFTDYARKGVDTRIVRIFNTYGPNMAKDDGRVVSNFIIQALKGDDITIYGTGNQSRSFQYIDDLVDGLITVMENNVSTPVNLGNPEEFLILELAQEILWLTKSSSQLLFLPLPKDDPCRRKPDIALAKTLGWKPKIPLEQGLLKTIEYFRWIL